jgi:hypothetical protein
VTNSICKTTAYLIPTICMVSSGIAHAQTTATQSSLSTGSGNSVKSGDLIFWTVNKEVTTVPPATSGSQAAADTAAATAATAANDRAAAAAAVASAAHSAIDAWAATVPPASASAPDQEKFRSKLQELETLAKAADDAANAAKTAAAPTPKVDSTTLAEAQNLVDAANQAVTSAYAALNTAHEQLTTDENAAAAAKNADAVLNQRVKGSTANVTNLKATLDQALDHQTAANAAFKDVTAKAKAAAAVVKPICFPKGSLFQVTSVLAGSSSNATPSTSGQAATPTNSPSSATATPSASQLVVSGHFPSPDLYEHILHPWHVNNTEDFKGRDGNGGINLCSADADIAVLDRTYDFTADKLAKQEGYRGGFTWGGLVIPYKFYFKDRSIKSNTSVVGFAGWEGWFPGLSVSTVIAAGGGTAPGSTTSSSSTPATGGATTSTTTAATSSTTLVTYTAAVGFIVAFGDSGTVKAGLMFGRDYQGNAAAFPYENKTWMALSIGAGF